LFPEVAGFINEALKSNIPSIPHRSQEFSAIVKCTVSELKKLLSVPDNFYVFFLSSATECMERALQNLAAKHSYHVVNGFFAERFFNISKQLFKKPQQVKVNYGSGITLSDLEIPEKSELVCITQNETSTGAALPPDGIKMLKEKYKEKIFVIDSVTGFPYYGLDFKVIDSAFFSVQKGFGLPPGLGVMLINKKCIEKTKLLKDNKVNTGSFNNFLRLAELAEKNQTSVTPNILGIYLLGKVCGMLNKYGLKKIMKETREKAGLIYGKFDNIGLIKPFVKEKIYRSETSVVLESNIHSEKLYKKALEAGFVISQGYGDYKNKHIRIGNFPMHKKVDLIKLLSVF
jgi:phosphoserine aminotransferase